MTRAYLRLDPGFDEHKYTYPDGAYAALIGTLCLAEQQPRRGRFRSLDYLRALLGKRGKWAKFLLEHHDVTLEADGTVYVDGWDEWQEGDWKVGERVRRIRGRERPHHRRTADQAPDESPHPGPPDTPPTVTSTVTGVTPETVTPSESVDSVGRQTAAVRSAGAGAGAGRTDSSLQPVETPEPREGRSRRNGHAPELDPSATLDAEQLEAWASFGPEWAASKAAWVGRGLKLPPTGKPDDDPRDSQRAALFEVLDARPHDLVRWIHDAPGKSGMQVVGYVLERWHAVQADVGAAEADDQANWFEAKRNDAESAGAILARLVAKP